MHFIHPLATAVPVLRGTTGGNGLSALLQLISLSICRDYRQLAVVILSLGKP